MTTLYIISQKRKLRLEIFLGEDTKCVVTVLGMYATNANFAYLYCKIENKNISNLHQYKCMYPVLDALVPSVRFMLRLVNNEYKKLTVLRKDITLQIRRIDVRHCICFM